MKEEKKWGVIISHYYFEKTPLTTILFAMDEHGQQCRTRRGVWKLPEKKPEDFNEYTPEGYLQEVPERGIPTETYLPNYLEREIRNAGLLDEDCDNGMKYSESQVKDRMMAPWDKIKWGEGND